LGRYRLDNIYLFYVVAAMKETTRTIQIKAYTDDDGKPVCGPCKANSGQEWCRDCNLARLVPGPTCPVWHGESKGEWQPMVHLLTLMEALEIPHPEWWLTKPPEFLAECGKAITAQAKQANPPQENEP